MQQQLLVAVKLPPPRWMGPVWMGPVTIIVAMTVNLGIVQESKLPQTL